MSDQVQSYELRNFREFLGKCLNRKVIDYTVKHLSTPGENYGSEIWSVDVQVASSGNSDKDVVDLPTKTIHMFCKSTVLDPSYAVVFQPETSFVKETGFYSDVMPAIEYFEEISNVPQTDRIDAFVHYYGSRLSLDPNAEIADGDALLLLENLKVQNYTTANRIIGFNKEETKAILRNLAEFHAICIAIRLLQPELFNSKINPFLVPIDLSIIDIESEELNTIHNELHLVDNLDPKLRAEIQKHLKIGDDFIRIKNRIEDTPYTTVIHRDLWVNNIVLKKDENLAVKIKFIDFQLYTYGSFVHDLLFTLFTSVRPIELKENFKSFIKYYHAVFIKTLENVKCPLDDYTFEKMWKEIQEKAKIELLHILAMIKVVTLDDTSVVSLEDFYNWTHLPDIVQTRWKLLIDTFSENGFI